jgi:predicted DNA-binding transcriptional regulator AlpA
VTAPRLLRLVEIAEMLGVSKQRANQLRRQGDFPEPVGRWARGDLLAAKDIRRWAQRWVRERPWRRLASEERS